MKDSSAVERALLHLRTNLRWLEELAAPYRVTMAATATEKSQGARVEEADHGAAVFRLRRAVGFGSIAWVGVIGLDARDRPHAPGLARRRARRSRGGRERALERGSGPALGEEGGRSPAALDAIVLRCLEKDPAARFASARELAEALERC